MHCRPLDPGDRYHARLANIVEEMRIATGAPRVDCVTVRTVGLNAFAFSDLRGGGVIGVTEGALAGSRGSSSRAVVAHEFAHILSGSYVTVTVSCLLFGIYSALAESLDGAADASSDTDAASAVVLMVPLRGWLWVMQLASSVVNAAISRQREWQADLAAVRYTRDPLALAEALRVISRHPGGAGYIPEGLAPLCIRATGSLGWPAVAWRDSHPPIEARIRTLLGVAHVSPAEFERQAAQAAEDFEGREHWAPAPGAAPAPALAGSRPASPGVAALSSTSPGAGVPLAASPGAASPAAAILDAGMTCPGCGAGLVRTPYEGIDIVVCAALWRPAGDHRADRQAARAAGGRLHGGSAPPRGPGHRLRRRPAPGRRAGPRPPRDGPRRLPEVRGADDAPALQLRVRRRGRLCARCDLTWFEKDELEALQILVERQAG